MQKNGLIRKIKLISKFMTSKLGKHAIAIHIFPNISRIKDNEKKKFDQLIKKSHKMWWRNYLQNFFLNKQN